MIEKLRHRSKLLSACRTACHHDAVAALGYGRRFIDECGEVVSVKFGTECAAKIGFEHDLASGEANVGFNDPTSPLPDLRSHSRGFLFVLSYGLLLEYHRVTVY
jgi:hypothetical protein